MKIYLYLGSLLILLGAVLASGALANLSVICNTDGDCVNNTPLANTPVTIAANITNCASYGAACSGFPTSSPPVFSGTTDSTGMITFTVASITNGNVFVYYPCGGSGTSYISASKPPTFTAAVSGQTTAFAGQPFGISSYYCSTGTITQGGNFQPVLVLVNFNQPNGDIKYINIQYCYQTCVGVVTVTSTQTSSVTSTVTFQITTTQTTTATSVATTTSTVTFTQSGTTSTATVTTTATGTATGGVPQPIRPSQIIGFMLMVGGTGLSFFSFRSKKQ